MLHKLLRHLAKIKQLYIIIYIVLTSTCEIFIKILKKNTYLHFSKILYPSMSLSKCNNGMPLSLTTYLAFLFIYLISICVFVYCTHACVHSHLLQACVWRSEDNQEEPFFSFHLMGPQDQRQVVRLGGKHLYLLSHYSGSMT